MGTTLDEAITVLKHNIDYAHGNNWIEQEQACMLAIETMLKYQKIEKLINDFKSDTGYFAKPFFYWLKRIEEVVEDGNDTNQ